MTDETQEYVTAGAENGDMDPRSVEEMQTSHTSATPESVEDLQRQLQESREEAAAQQEKFLRVRADMENYKKRIERTYAERSLGSKKELLRKLLAVKDNLERALHYGGSSDSDGESLMEGVRLTQYQLDQMLQKEGVELIDAAGKPFDPHLEEAIQTVNDASVGDQTVVQVVRSGYTYGDEVLRPAQVIVSVHESDS